MFQNFSLLIARVKNSSGKIRGAGFLVGEKFVITCAHVVKDALGLSSYEQPDSDQRLPLDFPLADQVTNSLAKVIFWSPPRPDGSGDIAGLELLENPKQSHFTSLVTAENFWGHDFQAYGFPVNHDEGVWASGVIRAKKANGWLQVEDTKVPGYQIEPGFSGSPVWNKQLMGVCGIVVAGERLPGYKAGAIIPTDVLIRSWPILGQFVLKPPICLGELYGKTYQDLINELKLYTSRSENSKQLPKDILTTGLYQLMLRNFQEAKNILKIYLGFEPTNAYGWYALALASLMDNRPKLLTRDSALLIRNHLVNALQFDKTQIHAALLLISLDIDYFKAKGFRTPSPTIAETMLIIEGGKITKSELRTLISFSVIPEGPIANLINLILSSN